MRSLGFLAIVALLAGCGMGVDGPALDTGEFETYFARLESYAAKRGTATRGLRAIPVALADLGSKENGRCEWNFLTGRRVLFSRSFWESATDDGREALFLHEMGHCFLHRSHREDHGLLENEEKGADAHAEGEAEPDRSEEDAPESLMHPTTLAAEVFARHRDHYLDELFGTKAKSPDPVVKGALSRHTSSPCGASFPGM